MPALGNYKSISVACVLAFSLGGCRSCYETDNETPGDDGFPRWAAPGGDAAAALQPRAALLKAQRAEVDRRVSTMEADSDGPTYAFSNFGGLDSTVVLSPQVNLLKSADGASGLFLKSENGMTLDWSAETDGFSITGIGSPGSVLSTPASENGACDNCAPPSAPSAANTHSGALTIENCEAYDAADIENQWYTGIAMADSRFEEGSESLELDGQSLRDKFMYYATVPYYRIKCDNTLAYCAQIEIQTCADGQTPMGGIPPYLITINPSRHDKYGGNCGWMGGTFVHEIMHTFMPSHHPTDPRIHGNGFSRRIRACEDFVVNLSEADRACCFDASEVVCGGGTPGRVQNGKRYIVTMSSSRTVRMNRDYLNVKATSVSNRTCAWRGETQAGSSAGTFEYNYCDITSKVSSVVSHTYAASCTSPTDYCNQAQYGAANLKGRADWRQPGTGGQGGVLTLTNVGDTTIIATDTVMRTSLEADSNYQYLYQGPSCCAAEAPVERHDDTAQCSACAPYPPDGLPTPCNEIFGGALAGGDNFLDTDLLLYQHISNADAIGFGAWNETTVEHTVSPQLIHFNEMVSDTEVIRWRIDPK
jgi:hypothetical protein